MSLPKLTRKLALDMRFIPKTEAGPIRTIMLGSGRYIQNHPMQSLHAADYGSVAFVDLFEDEEGSTQARVDRLNANERLYTSVLRGLVDGNEVVIPTVIHNVAAVHGPSENAAFLDYGRNPNIELIISQTTESGMFEQRVQNNTLGDIDPYRIHRNGAQVTTPGKIAHFLIERESAGITQPVIWIPTELLENQGDIGLRGVQQLLDKWKSYDVLDNLDQLLIVGNNVVDKICTGDFTDPDYESQRGYTGLFTAAEPFQEFIIADPTGKIRQTLPFLEKVGVTFTDDSSVSPAFWKKYGLLNCSHTTLVSVGLAMGIETVKEAVEHPLVGDYLKALQNEVVEGYRDFPYSQNQLTTYAAGIRERFSNPFIEHHLSAIALNHADKMRTRITSTGERFAEGSDMKHIVFSLAAGLYKLNDGDRGINVRHQMNIKGLLGELPTSIVAEVKSNYESISNYGMQKALQMHMKG